MKISQLQEYSPKDFSGLIQKNHLGQIFMEDGVQDVPGTIGNIYQVNYGDDLENFLRQFPVLSLNTDDDFRWRLQGRNDKNIPLVGAFTKDLSGTLTAITAASEVGRASATFILRFPEAYFTAPVIIAGERNEVYPIRVIAGPIANGTNYDYECDLFVGDPDLFIPAEELASGKRFSTDWNVSEQTLSKDGTMPTYTSPFSMRNCFTMMRMKNIVPGNMINRPLAFPFVDYKTKKVANVWLQYTDWEFYKQFRQMQNRMLMYATTNRASDGTFKQVGPSGMVLQQGAGLRQQMDPSNTSYYNTFDIDWFVDKMLQLSVGKLDKQNRGFLVRTGTWGMVQASRAMELSVQKFTPLTDNYRLYSKGANGEQGYKGQIVEWMGPEGTKITFMVDNMYDDDVRNKIKHPSGKGVAESYTYDIYALGNSSEPNIQLVNQKGTELIMRYIPGMRDPFSPSGQKTKPGLAVSAVDGYEVHYMSNLGAMIKDPTKTMRVIHNSLGI